MKITDEQVLMCIRQRQQLGLSLSKNECNVSTWGIGRNTVVRRFGSWNKALKAAGITNIHAHGTARPTHPCIVCNKPTKNPKFCSRSCAATVNNRIKPKRIRKVYNCKKCGRTTSKPRRTLCDTCLQGRTVTNMTLAQCIAIPGKDASKYAIIRHDARNRYYTSGTTCESCGYDKHIEVCHIRKIADFPLNTTVGEINTRNNIKLLCPNCHWEFDNLPTSTSVKHAVS